MSNLSEYRKLLTNNPAVILVTNINYKVSTLSSQTYSWVDLRKNLINADGRYSVLKTSETQKLQVQYFPNAVYTKEGNRFYIKAREFEAFCSEQATKFFEDVSKLSTPQYLNGWCLINGYMDSVNDNLLFQDSSRLVGYPLLDSGTHAAYALQMGDTAMTLRTEFSNPVVGMYHPQEVTPETLTLAGNFLYLINNHASSYIYAQLFDSRFDSLYSFDVRYFREPSQITEHLELIHKEHNTLLRIQSLQDKLVVNTKQAKDTDYRDYYLRVLEIMHDRASLQAVPMLVGTYKPRQSVFKNTCRIINAGNYDLEQAIEITIEAARISRKGS
jgi:hypothetical protein